MGHLAREQAREPFFDPIRFFAGRTHGVGVLSVAFRKPQRTDVSGRGRIEADGSISLNQTVKRGGSAAVWRQWRLYPLADGRFTGTLTDAKGPVTGETTGNRLHLSFGAGGGLRYDQWLYLQPGGRTARNRLIVTKFGLPVAKLDETITRMAE